MTTNTAVEQIPTTWDDTRDGDFFRITARIFTPAFCLGASVLFASNDHTVSGTQRTRPVSSTATPAGDDRSQAQAERELIPVQVRRTR